MTPHPNHTVSSTGHTVIAGLLIAVATLTAFHELTAHPSDLLVGVHKRGNNDLTAWFLRARSEERILWDRFDRPANWNPYLGLGSPVQGNAQAAMFYPPNWMFLIVDAQSAISWLMLLHLWFAGCGVWKLASRSGLHPAASLFAGIAAAIAPYAVAHAAEGHVAQICTVAWVPWILVAFQVFLASNGRKWQAVTACFAVSALAGHVQEIYYLALLLTGSVLVSVYIRAARGERQAAISVLTNWCIAGVLTGGIAAVDVLPVWLNNQLTVRTQQLPLAVAGDGVSLANLQQLLNPFALGRPDDPEAGHQFYWIRLMHFGVVPLVLAVIGTVWYRRRSEVRHMCVWLLVAFVFAFGTATPFYELTYRFVPMMSSFRLPCRILFFCAYGMAFLSAFGLDLILTSASRDGLKSTSRKPGNVRVVFAILLLMAMCIELTRHVSCVVATVPRESLRGDSPVSQYLKTGGEYDRVLANQLALSDFESMNDGRMRVRSYEPVPNVRLMLALEALFNLPADAVDFTGFAETELAMVNESVADLIGLKHFVTMRPQPERDGWKLAARGRLSPFVSLRGVETPVGAFGVFENLEVLPRAFMVGKAQEIRGLNAVEAVAALKAVNPKEAVLLNRDVLPTQDRTDFRPAVIETYGADRVVITTDADAAGYLVLTDLYHPGWAVRVDGVPAQLLQANVSFRGVALSPGSHTVEFVYTCRGFRAGLAVSVISLLAVGFTLYRDRMNRTAGNQTAE